MFMQIVIKNNIQIYSLDLKNLKKFPRNTALALDVVISLYTSLIIKTTKIYFFLFHSVNYFALKGKFVFWSLDYLDCSYILNFNLRLMDITDRGLYPYLHNAKHGYQYTIQSLYFQQPLEKLPQAMGILSKSDSM